MPLTNCMLEEEFDILCGDVGITNPPVFDKQALAFCTRYARRDVVFEISLFDPLIPGSIIPSLLVKRSHGSENLEQVPTRLVLMDMQKLEEAKDFITQFSTIQRACHRSCSLIGLNGNARQDLKEIDRSSEVFISTPQRMIDHIRRENVSLAHVENLTVLRLGLDEDDTHSFDQDVLFIRSKLPDNASTHVFTPDVEEMNEMKHLLRHPKVVSRSDWCFANQTVYTCLHDHLSAEDVLHLLYSRRSSQALILCEGEEAKQQLKQIFSSTIIPLDVSIATFQDYRLEQAEESNIMVVFGAHYPLLDMIFNPRTNPTPDVQEIFILYHPGQKSNLDAIQEIVTMKHTQQSKPTDSDVLSGKIKLLLEEVKQYKQPDELARMKRIMKKNVPFHLRSYLFAYLLQEKLSNDIKGKEHKGRLERDQDGMVTLFVSIGKNKKVYPKDLIKLFNGQLEISDNDIGTVRVLDNYSFVNIAEEKGQEAVNKMNNIKFRGKSITVDFAKKKTV